MKIVRPPFAAARATASRLLLAGLIAAPGTVVLAQATAPTDAAPAATQPAPAAKDVDTPDRHIGMGHHDPATMQARASRHQAELKDKLKITSAQEPAWSAFTAALKPPETMMQDRRSQHAELQKLPTPERIDKMRALRTQHMTEMMRRMDQRGEATKALYAALSPEQQKTFDLEASQRGGRHAGGHHDGKHRNS